MNQNELFEKIESFAADTGFCEYKIIDAKNVVFMKAVRTLCEQECEEHHISSYSLPPFISPYEECVEQCMQYPYAMLVSSIHPANDLMSMEEWMAAGSEMNIMLKQLEAKMQRCGISALPLGMRCRRCEKCACPSEPCRNPESLLPATEAYGLHIMNTMEQHGITGYYDGQTIVCFGIVFFNFYALQVHCDAYLENDVLVIS